MFFLEVRLNSRRVYKPFCMNAQKHSQKNEKVLWCAQVTQWCGGWINRFENCTKVTEKKKKTGSSNMRTDKRNGANVTPWYICINIGNLWFLREKLMERSAMMGTGKCDAHQRTTGWKKLPLSMGIATYQHNVNSPQLPSASMSWRSHCFIPAGWHVEHLTDCRAVESAH